MHWIRGLIAPRHEHRILAAMLAVLHLALWSEFGGSLSRSLMLAHLGLFLLWQPLWRREQRIEPRAALSAIGATAIVIVWFDWLLMGFWALLLIGLIGGRVTTTRRQRLVYLLVLLMLVSEVLVRVAPAMFSVQLMSPAVSKLFRYGLMLIPVAIFVLPSVELDAEEAGLDFFYGLTVALITMVLVLGSLLRMYASTVDYAVALFQTVFGIALFLLAISWLWLPVAGFSGFGQLWERYVQNVGTPFEHWLSRLTSAARVQRTPEEFLDSAVAQLLELPWVAGVAWDARGVTGESGERTAYSFGQPGEEVDLQVYTYRPLGTTLLLHGVLLLRLVGHFYRAKVRERELASRAHLKAIYETGARVTHDIKNLLQSLHALSTAVQDTDERRAGEVQALLRRQLPRLSERLQLSLDKLSASSAAQSDDSARASLRRWWEDLVARNVGREVEFTAELEEDPQIPVEFFDSVADNLLENARLKRVEQPGIRVGVGLRASGGHVRLTVSDDGAPIDPEIARTLFVAPVRSRSGLGVGLYQASRLALHHGYRLRLDQHGGRVEFVLEKRVEGEDEDPRGAAPRAPSAP